MRAFTVLFAFLLFVSLSFGNVKPFLICQDVYDGDESVAIFGFEAGGDLTTSDYFYVDGNRQTGFSGSHSPGVYYFERALRFRSSIRYVSENYELNVTAHDPATKCPNEFVITVKSGSNYAESTVESRFQNRITYAYARVSRVYEQHTFHIFADMGRTLGFAVNYDLYDFKNSWNYIVGDYGSIDVDYKAMPIKKKASLRTNSESKFFFTTDLTLTQKLLNEKPENIASVQVEQDATITFPGSTSVQSLVMDLVNGHIVANDDLALKNVTINIVKGDMIVYGDLTIGDGSTINLGHNSLIVYGSLQINGTLNTGAQSYIRVMNRLINTGSFHIQYTSSINTGTLETVGGEYILHFTKVDIRPILVAGASHKILTFRNNIGNANVVPSEEISDCASIDASFKNSALYAEVIFSNDASCFNSEAIVSNAFTLTSSLFVAIVALALLA